MDIQVDLDGRRDLAGQIYRQIRAAIVDGHLRAGEALPPSRELARQLAVSRNTVGVAYDRLQGEGFIEARIGAGTYVCAHLAVSDPPGPHRTRQELTPHPGWLTSYPTWNAIGWELTQETIQYDFGIGVPDISLFPFETWRRLVSRELRLSSVRTAMYGQPAGHLGLRAAIARHIGVSRAVSADPESICVTNGAQQAFDLIAHVLLQPGDCVAVEEPGYPPLRMIMNAHGARVSPVRVDHQGIVVAEIPEEARLIYVTPAHQFPLGLPMSLSRRIELLTWAAEHDAAIIEDDYDSEFRFGGRPIETLYGLDTSGRVLYVGTFSKTMFPAIRLGFIVMPKSLAQAVRLAKFATDWHSPLINQAALARFIDEGLFARHLRKMRIEYAGRHQQIRSVLAEQGDWLTPIDSVAGLHLAALLPDSQQLSVEDLLSRASGSGVLAWILQGFYAGEQATPGLVLGYGAIPVPRIAEGLGVLRRALAL
jgi:GntR family transcriptional regulator / MocR family aminotransferase